MFIYHILDILFLVFHTSLIIFNLFGWIWRKTRKINLLTLFLTGLSWSLIGAIVGVPGYCPFTDWHFSILEKLGHADLPSSYVKYVADRITGLSFNPGSIDKVTLYCFLAALIISITVNATDIIRRKRVLKRVNSQVKL
jgi:hypothetical protein